MTYLADRTSSFGAASAYGLVRSILKPGFVFSCMETDPICSCTPFDLPLQLTRSQRADVLSFLVRSNQSRLHWQIHLIVPRHFQGICTTPPPIAAETHRYCTAQPPRAICASAQACNFSTGYQFGRQSKSSSSRLFILGSRDPFHKTRRAKHCVTKGSCALYDIHFVKISKSALSRASGLLNTTLPYSWWVCKLD